LLRTDWSSQGIVRLTGILLITQKIKSSESREDINTRDPQRMVVEPERCRRLRIRIAVDSCICGGWCGCDVSLAMKAIGRQPLCRPNIEGGRNLSPMQMNRCRNCSLISFGRTHLTMRIAPMDCLINRQ